MSVVNVGRIELDRLVPLWEGGRRLGLRGSRVAAASRGKGEQRGRERSRETRWHVNYPSSSLSPSAPTTSKPRSSCTSTWLPSSSVTSTS